jgi:hypothetical protein
VVLPSNITLRNGTATFCAFVKYFDDGSGNLTSGSRFFDFGNGNTTRDSIFAGNFLTSRDLRFETRNGTVDANALTSAQTLTVAIGFWAHLCFSIDAMGSKRAFVNGVLVAGPTAPQATSLSTVVRTTNFFGRPNNASSAYFRGVCVCVCV